MNLPYAMTLLGSLRVALGTYEASAPIVTRFRTQKTAALLAYLACHQDRPQPREELIDRFWPDADFDTGRISLRTALASLRRQIEPPGISSNTVLIANRTTVHLNPSAVVTDISRFEAALAAARRAASPSERLPALQAALSLYAGPLLPGFYDEWALLRREHLAELHRQALRQIVTDLARVGDLPAALIAARQAAGADPQDAALREILERLLMAADKIDRRDVLQLLEEPDAPSLPIIFTPPALKNAIGNLPLLLDRFFGRIEERERLGEALAASETRIVTITGPGGMGKTRLAIELATTVRESWAHGAWFVALRETQTATSVAIAIRDTLHLPAKENVDPLGQVIDALASKGDTPDAEAKALLVLDNFEHLDADAAAIVLQLLRALPQLKCLVTSRRRLALPGERLFPIAPLPIPTTSDATAPQSLAAIESVQLFVDRAQASRPDFQITERNAAAVALLCADLEGIPLAIELAAAWSQVLTPAQMRERLTARFDLLAPRPQAAARPGRPHSLQDTIAWSYDLLAPQLREFLTRLSVFRGGWTAPAAQKIVSDSDHVLDFLAQLRERSLIRSEETPTGTFRFGMFETIREFAASQLSPENAIPVRDSHANYFTELAETSEPNLRGPEGPHLLRALEEEYPNLQAALEYYLSAPDTVAPALRLASALGWFWDLRSRWTEGRAYLARAIARIDPTEDLSVLRDAYASALSASGRLAYQRNDNAFACDVYEKALAIRRIEGNKAEIGKLLLGLAGIAFHTGDIARAQALTEENLTLRREIDDRPGIAAALAGLASIALNREDYELARTYASESLTMRQELGDTGGMAHVLYILGMIAVRMESGREATPYFERGLALQRELNNVQGICHGLCGLANIALEAKEYATAEHLYEEAQESAQRIGDLWTTAVLLNNRSRIAFERGEPTIAQTYACESLRLRHQIGDASGTATMLDALAIYAQSANAPDRAAFLWGASHTLREALQKPVEETLRAEQTDCQSAVLNHLGESAFNEMWNRGASADREAVVQFALAAG